MFAQVQYGVSRVQLNFLQLGSVEAVQQLSLVSSNHPHPSHTKWKQGHAPSVRLRGLRGEMAATTTLGRRQGQLLEPRPQCEIASHHTPSSQSHYECTLHFELSTRTHSLEVEEFPVVDIAVATEMCGEDSPCRLELGPACFSADAPFSGG